MMFLAVAVLILRHDGPNEYLAVAFLSQSLTRMRYELG